MGSQPLGRPPMCVAASRSRRPGPSVDGKRRDPWWSVLFVLLIGCSDITTTSLPPPTVDLSDVIPTVATARWSASTDGLDEAYVVTSGPSGEILRAPATHDGHEEFEATLLGMKPNRVYGLVAVVVDETGTRVSEEALVRTGSGPPDLPELSPNNVRGPRWDACLHRYERRAA